VTRKKTPIYIALGANLPTASRTPVDTLEAALAALEREGVAVEARSAWYVTAPVPRSDQPDYVNGAVRVATALGPEALLAALHRVEHAFGRVRLARNEARVLDLDLIDYGGLVADREGLTLPHPRAHLRGFVLVPLRDVAPDWVHPATRQPIEDLIRDLPDANEIRRL
jgi:2-amino-4-hydroxy-6-hydroxymethyldihydropteridine diphosphokinase